MNESPQKTCQTMQMDPGQVRLILMHVDAHPEEYAPELPGEPKEGSNG